jgi:hypothetical protein
MSDNFAMFYPVPSVSDNGKTVSAKTVEIHQHRCSEQVKSSLSLEHLCSTVPLVGILDLLVQQHGASLVVMLTDELIMQK